MTIHPNFVAIDGPNGVGKSSIIEALKIFDSSIMTKAIFTKEPTASQLGTFIRANQDKYHGHSLAALVSADRYDHIERIIKPALSAGQMVITDRYLASSLVYQVIDGLTPSFVLELNSQILLPSLYFVLTCNVDVIAERLRARTELTRFEIGDKLKVESQLFKESREILQSLNITVVEVDTSISTASEMAQIISKKIQEHIKS